MTVRFKRLAHASGIDLPNYATKGAAGMDLRAAVTDDLTLAPLQRFAVPTGFEIAIPAGYEGQVRARSGRAFKEGLALVNAPGTIDEDYRGELKVIVINLGSDPIVIKRGERIAQLVVVPVAQVPIAEVLELDETDRAKGGFGSTGR